MATISSHTENHILNNNMWKKDDVYWIYFASCMNIIVNELRQQRVKYDVHTTSKIKHTLHFLSYIIFIANLSAILIWTIL